MPWKTKKQIATSLSATDTEVFSDYVELEPGAIANVQVKADFSGVPTDDLEVRTYLTLDPSSEVSDNQADTPITMAKETDPAYRTFTVKECYKFRLGFKASGATDTITVDAWVAKSKGEL